MLWDTLVHALTIVVAYYAMTLIYAVMAAILNITLFLIFFDVPKGGEKALRSFVFEKLLV